MFCISCKEEPLQSKDESKSLNLVDAKLSNQAFIDIQNEKDKPGKKEKFEKLKKEHELPFAVLEDPIETLKQCLSKRNNNNAPIPMLKKAGEQYLQNSPCETLYTDVWALEKYLPISGNVIGISPGSSWQDNLGLLQNLKNIYGFRRIYVSETKLGYPKTAGFLSNEIVVVVSQIAYLDDIINNHNASEFSHCFINEPQIFNDINYIKQMLSACIGNWNAKFAGDIMLGERTYELADEFDQ